MKWFRMYTSLVDSIKVGPLTAGQFRVYIELLCLAGEKGDGGRTGVTPENINWRLRRDVTCDVTEVVTKGLVTMGGDNEYVVLDWDERQYKTDSSAERTRDYRARKAAKVLKEKDVTDGAVTGDGSDAGGDCVDTDTEENREEKGPARKRAPAIRLSTFIALVKEADEKFLPDDDPIYEYAQTIGLTQDMLRVAYLKFKDRYTDEDKRYADWRRVFRKSVKERWMKLWYLDAASGKVQLTTDGRLAMEQFKGDAVLRRAA